MNDHGDCYVEPVVKEVDQNLLEKSVTAVLAVSGMNCPRCAMRVRNSLLNTEGVMLVDVLVEKGLAGVAYDPTHITPQTLVERVAAAGDSGHHRYEAMFLRNMPSVGVWNNS